MAGTTYDLGTGTSIAFGTSGYAAILRAITGWTGISREVVDFTPLAVAAASPGTIGNRVYKAAHAVDPGTIECEFFFNPNLTPPIGGDPETITVTFPIVTGDSTAAYWQAQGMMLTFEVSGIELDQPMVARSTIKITGAITFTAAT